MKIKAITIDEYTAWMTDDKDFVPLQGFAQYILRSDLGQLLPCAVHNFGVINGVVLDRDAQFQVELFIVEPGAELPPHGHPDVDSLEVYLAGEIDFLLEGRSVLRGAMKNKMVGHMIRVLPGQSHGAKIGPSGGSFLSIQRWLNGVQPTSVGLNWSGEPHEAEAKEKYASA